MIDFHLVVDVETNIFFEQKYKKVVHMMGNI